MKQLLFLLLGIAFSFQAISQTPPFVQKYPNDFDTLTGHYVLYGDIDGDTDIDVVASTGVIEDSIKTTIYVNNGVGQYSRSTASNTLDQTCLCVALADFTGDNTLDLLQYCVTVGSPPTNLKFRIAVNNGSGVFQVDTNLSTDLVNVSGRYSYVLDFDNDGNMDVLTCGPTGLSNPPMGGRLFRNTGMGKFEATDKAFAAFYQTEPLVADLNGDDFTDLGFIFLDTLRLYWNDGMGNFNLSPVTYYVDGSENTLVLDANGDGLNDFITYNPRAGSMPRPLIQQINQGDGTFEIKSTGILDLGTYGRMKAADFDLDGDEDIVILGGGNSQDAIIYLNDGSGAFTKDSDARIYSAGPNGTRSAFPSLNVFDCDGDSDTDILLAFPGSTENIMLFSNESILTSIEEHNLDNNIELFPNPVQNTLQVSGLEESPNYTIYTLQGSLVQAGLAHPGETLDVTRLKSGMYLLKLEMGEHLKFVKE